MDVYIDTRTVGQHFATKGILRRIGTGRVVAEAETIRPYGFAEAAALDARTLAARKGYTVVEDAS